MNVEDEEWVQHALIDFERKHCISKVLSMECKDAVPKGNNYGSDMYRFNMKLVLHSGDVVKRSVIYKAVPQTETRKKLFKEANIHTKESRMYSDVLEEMERIRRIKEPGVERFSPTLYGIKRGHEGYLLEDLTEMGYKMADRYQGLDFRHAKLVMKALGQFHALSVVLIDRGEIAIGDFNDNYFVNHPGTVDGMILTSFSEIAKLIEEKWQGEWLIYADKLREFSKVVIPKFIEECVVNEKNFNVLLHGDCWTTNMMFRYNSEGEPQNIRFLDFQLSHYNNVGLDLQYFFHTALGVDALKKKSELLQLYYENLKHHLSLYGYSRELPSFEHIQESYDRAKVYGMTVGLGFKPLMMNPSESVPDDLEKWTQELVSNTGPKPPNLDSEILQEMIKIILKDAEKAGIF